MTEMLWLLLLLAAVGASCYYAGWRSAAAYMGAAKAVSDVTNVVASQANSFSSSLEKAALESGMIRKALEKNTEVINARLGSVEEAFALLFQGFKEAGIVRQPRPTTPRQVGEAPLVQD